MQAAGGPNTGPGSGPGSAPSQGRGSGTGHFNPMVERRTADKSLIYTNNNN